MAPIAALNMPYMLALKATWDQNAMALSCEVATGCKLRKDTTFFHALA